MVECDPDKCSVEKRVEKSDRRAPKRSLWCALRQEWWHSVAHFRVVPERLASVAREPENARLGGCAGSPKPTCLSLQFGEIQGDFAKLQGQRRLIPAECHRTSMGWIDLSLIQGAGRPHSIAGKVELETPRRCSLVTFTQLSSTLRVSFRTSTYGPPMSPTDPKRTYRSQNR